MNNATARVHTKSKAKVSPVGKLCFLSVCLSLLHLYSPMPLLCHSAALISVWSSSNDGVTTSDGCLMGSGMVVRDTHYSCAHVAVHYVSIPFGCVLVWSCAVVGLLHQPAVPLYLLCCPGGTPTHQRHAGRSPFGVGMSVTITTATCLSQSSNECSRAQQQSSSTLS